MSLPEITPAQETLLRQYGARLADGFKLQLVLNRGEADALFQAFAERLAAFLPRLRLTTRMDADAPLPGFYITPGLRYHALPLEAELEPFLQALVSASGLEDIWIAPDAIAAQMRLFIATGCPHCPSVVRHITHLAFEEPIIELDVIDGELFPDAAASHQVRSAPTLILDDHVRWTGPVNVREVAAMVKSRDLADMGPDAMQTLLHQGRADDLARMMRERQMIFPAVLKLVGHAMWQVRLGAMVVMEELAETDPDIAEKGAKALSENFSSLAPDAKGDVLYVLGLCGNQDTADQIEKWLRDETAPDIREAGQEAIAAIMSRVPAAPV